MNRGASKDYRFGTKDHWRRWMWNRIADRLLVPPKSATAIYFAGNGDHDRREAIRRGFHGGNLISIERDEPTARSLRARGVTVIPGDALEILAAWPPGRPCNVLALDFCSGVYVDRVFEIGGILTNPAFDGAVLAANFLRGRDDIQRHFPKLHAPGAPIRFPETIDEKHRGAKFALGLSFRFLVTVERALALILAANHDPEISSDLDRELFAEPLLEEDLAAYRSEIFDMVNGASFHTYRSTAGSQVFDSVVLKIPSVPSTERSKPRRTVARSISAALAVSTMRRRGDLRCAW